MKTPAILIAAALLLPAFGASAQAQLLSAVPDAQELVGFYPAAASQPVASSPASASTLTYFGVVNSQDARHEQYAQLRQAFAASQPTLVLVEKPDCGIANTAEATIRTKGAAGYARLLAQQHHVPVERLDDPVAEYEYLRTKIDPEQLKLYYLLRASQQFRASTGASKALTVKAMKSFIANSAHFLPGTEQVIRNVAELDAAYQKYCPAAGKWWAAPTTYFCPQAAVALYPSGSFSYTINHAISEYRERYVYSKLAARAQAGERILVVMSCDQLPAPAAVGTLAVATK